VEPGRPDVRAADPVSGHCPFAVGACCLALLCACSTTAPPETVHVPAEQPVATAGERDPADLSLAAIRLQAQIDKQIEEYQSRPRKKLSAGVPEHRFAKYEEEWRQRIERVGEENYPEEVRGRIHGQLRLSVAIRPDGTVDSITLDRSSGHEVLDRAAFQIVRRASPFPPFPPEIRRDTDLLVITRTWFFGRQVEARPSQ
jgi:protein TonB